MNHQNTDINAGGDGQVGVQHHEQLKRKYELAKRNNANVKLDELIFDDNQVRRLLFVRLFGLSWLVFVSSFMVG